VTLPIKRGVEGEIDVAFAVGSLQSGGLVGPPSDPAHADSLEALAATLPEIFGTVDPACLDRIAARLCGEVSGQGFAEVLLISESQVQVVRPLARGQNSALVALSSATHKDRAGALASARTRFEPRGRDMTHAAAPSSRMLSSIPANPGLIASVSRLLSYIDDLPAGATGALHFAGQGVILLESRKICWAVARSMRVRLTDILRNQSTPPVPREAVEDLYRRCKETGAPIGEALVASGLATEPGLKAALFKHNSEAIAALARAGVAPDQFVNHGNTGYDPKFSYSPCEMLAVLGAFDDPARAAAAQHELGAVLVQESVGAAFVRSSAASGALIIAVDRGCDFAVADLTEICNWVSGLFDVARTCDPEVFAARASFGPNAALVTWRIKDVGYIGLCASRAAAARLVSRLSERLTRVSGVLPVGARGGDESA
jgi:hypothetical protein